MIELKASLKRRFAAHFQVLLPAQVCCDIFGHDRVYTEEYRNADGHVQADSVCTRCGDARLAWTGPPVQEVEDACSIRVPTKEEAYAEV